MSIKLKVKDVFDMDSVLTKLVERDLPIKISFKLGKFVKALLDQARGIEESRVALMKKYTKQDDNGKFIIDPDKAEDFRKEFDELLKEDITLLLDPLPYSILTEIDYLSISTRDMMVLSPLFEDEPKEKN